MRFRNTEVWGFKHAIRGMRNPKNSWDRIDSTFEPEVKLGENDLKLCLALIRGGSEHRKFLRQIFVSVDITAPLYFWKEYDTSNEFFGCIEKVELNDNILCNRFEMSDFNFNYLDGYKQEVHQCIPPLTTDELNDELWIPIVSDYEISNFGRCKHVFKRHSRIIRGSIHQDGYIFVTLHGVQYPIHRLVAEKFCTICGNKEDLVVNHLDGNKQNNRATNLEWVTQAENVQHSYKNHLQPKGISTYTGKFTPTQREQIKKEYLSGMFSIRELASKYNVSHTTISAIGSDKYSCKKRENLYETVARPLVDTLNTLRDLYIAETNDIKKEKILQQVLQILPESYMYSMTIVLTYEDILNMVHQRKNHKLNEWSGKDNDELENFISWALTLPYMKEFLDVLGEKYE